MHFYDMTNSGISKNSTDHLNCKIGETFA